MPRDRWLKAREEYKARRESFGSYWHSPTHSELRAEYVADQERERRETKLHRRQASRFVWQVIHFLQEHNDTIWESDVRNEMYNVHEEFTLRLCGFNTYHALLQYMAQSGVICLTYDDTRADWKILCKDKHEATISREVAHERASDFVEEDQPSPMTPQESQDVGAADRPADSTMNADEPTECVLTALRETGGERAFVNLSLVKVTVLQSTPTFCESDFGFTSFKRFLEHLQTKQLVTLRCDPITKAWSVRLSCRRRQCDNNLTNDTIHGFTSSRRSHVFHTLDCESGAKILPDNLIRYVTRESAMKAGKSPCSECSP